MGDTTIRVLYKAPGQGFEFRSVENNLRGLQSLLDGGYLEAVGIGNGLVLFVDEDGIRKHLSINIAGILGPLFVCRVTPGEVHEEESLTEEDFEYAKEWLMTNRVP